MPVFSVAACLLRGARGERGAAPEGARILYCSVMKKLFAVCGFLCTFAAVIMKARKKIKSSKSRRKTWKQRTLAGKLWRVLWVSALSLLVLMHVEVLAYKYIFPPVTPLMAQRFCQQLLGRDRRVNFERDYVRLDAIDRDLVNSVVASEDGNFMRHHGFDVRQLKESYMENQRGRRVRGGSTISMQTAKNAFLPHRRSMLRKAVEAYFTQLIEWCWGKERIMEVYLNIIEFGDGIYGCEAAAQHYYGHSAAHLTRREAAELAATLPSPLRRNPARATPGFRRHAAAIQARAARYGTVRLDRAKEIRERDRRKGRHDETILDFAVWMMNQKKAEKMAEKDM